MNNPPKTVIVTGASQGIGAGIVRAFLARGYNVVGTARNATKARDLSASDPIAGVPASVPMITKGGLNAVIGSLALEYAKEHIRFNVVAPGVVDTPLHADDSNDVLKTLSPMGTISTVEEIASAAVYLTEARQITGEVLRVDGGAHVGKW